MKRGKTGQIKNGFHAFRRYIGIVIGRSTQARLTEKRKMANLPSFMNREKTKNMIVSTNHHVSVEYDKIKNVNFLDATWINLDGENKSVVASRSDVSAEDAIEKIRQTAHNILKAIGDE